MCADDSIRHGIIEQNMPCALMRLCVIKILLILNDDIVSFNSLKNSNALQVDAVCQGCSCSLFSPERNMKQHVVRFDANRPTSFSII